MVLYIAKGIFILGSSSIESVPYIQYIVCISLYVLLYSVHFAIYISILYDIHIELCTNNFYFIFFYESQSTIGFTFFPFSLYIIYDCKYTFFFATPYTYIICMTFIHTNRRINLYTFFYIQFSMYSYIKIKI